MNCSQRIIHVTADNADTFYGLVASGTDFYFYQDLGNDSYDEHYFNPDCVLLFPETRQVYWFDLDYLTVASRPSGVRYHLPGNLWRKKFAFSYHDNQKGVLVYTLLHSKVSKVTEMERQHSVTTKYILGERYNKLCEFSADGEERPQEGVDLQSAWKLNRKMKIGVKLGKSMLIYPVRLAFRQKGIYSFASKSVVIPHPHAIEFSWDYASIGNICVSSDGSCSIYRQNKPRNAFNSLLGVIFPNSMNYFGRIFNQNQSQNKLKEEIKTKLQRYCGSTVRKYALPFEIEYLKCPFIIFGRERP